MIPKQNVDRIADLVADAIIKLERVKHSMVWHSGKDSEKPFALAMTLLTEAAHLMMWEFDNTTTADNQNNQP
jgi:hypothetical protein